MVMSQSLPKYFTYRNVDDEAVDDGGVVDDGVVDGGVVDGGVVDDGTIDDGVLALVVDGILGDGAEGGAVGPFSAFVEAVKRRVCALGCALALSGFSIFNSACIKTPSSIKKLCT